MLEIRDIRLLKSAVAPEDWPEGSYPEAAFVGRSNVGKSSLINMVVQRRQLARISGTPGKTRTLNFYLANDRFLVVDLPGFGYAKVARSERNAWQRLIHKYITTRPTLQILFHLIDGRHDMTTMDHDLVGMMKQTDVPYVIALTKSDKLSGNVRSHRLRKTNEVLARYGLELPVVLTSAKDGRGRDEIMGWIESMVSPD
jgi:GTP-binding protein